MVCLDSDILIAFLRGDRSAGRKMDELREKAASLKTTVMNEYELLKGAKSTNREENLRAVRRLISGMEVLTLDEDAAEIGASIYEDLQRGGRLINEFDVLVAGIAMRNEETVISRDGEFKRIPNLSIETW